MQVDEPLTPHPLKKLAPGIRFETAPIDPLCDVVGGRYQDDLVVVARRGDSWSARVRGGARTLHFDMVTHNRRLLVTHDVRSEDVDDDLTGVIVDELFTPGWVRGSEMFQRIFTGVVRTSATDALECWELFYRNTIRRLALSSQSSPSAEWEAAAVTRVPGSCGDGSIADHAPVYDRVVSLVGPGSVLELGSCFGFLSLRLAAAGHPTTASDVSPGAVRLLASIAARLGVPLVTLLADAARVPVIDGFADTVVVSHLLEQLDPDHGHKVVVEALRCARRRVIIAVPLEREADETYGHLRTISLDDLRTWGRASRVPFEVAEHQVGWLILDKPHR